MRLAYLAAAAALASPFHAHAQTTVYGAEPNNTKEEATPALGLQSGDSIELDFFGSTTNPGADGLNFFRVGTATATPGIYEHRLIDSFSEMRLFGEDSFPDQVLPGSIAIFQSSVDAGSAQAPLTWYGFGQAEEVFVDLTPVKFFRLPSYAELDTREIIPTDLGTIPTFGNDAATVTISAFPFGAPFDRDIEIHLFDAYFRAMPAHWSDRPFVGTYAGSFDASLPEGTYYVAMADGDVATHLPASQHMASEIEQLNSVLDFTGAIAANGMDSLVEMRIVISGGGGAHLTGDATKVNPFEITWFKFTVGTEETSFVFCDGDSTPVPCPCENNPGSRRLMGCVNSTGRGASSIAWRENPFTPADRTFVSFFDLPPFATTLPFVALGTGPPLTYYGGNVCLDPASTARLSILFADGAGNGEAIMDQGALPGILSGQTVYLQAAYRDVDAAAGCEVNFTSGTGFRLHF